MNVKLALSATFVALSLLAPGTAAGAPGSSADLKLRPRCAPPMVVTKNECVNGRMVRCEYRKNTACELRPYRCFRPTQVIPCRSTKGPIERAK